MKWIGQQVYNLVSRFRGDVYINRDLYFHQTQSALTGAFSEGASDDGRVLYLDSDGKVTNSHDLKYDSSNEILTIGDPDNGYATVRRRPRSTTNDVGGSLALEAGQSTGSGIGGLVYLGTSAAGSSGTSLNAITEKLTLWPINNASGFAGDGSAFSGLTNPDYTQVTMPGGLGIYADGNTSDVGSQPKIILAPRTTTAHVKNTKLSEIETKGNNDAQELTSYSLIRTSTGGAPNNDTDEHGVLEIKVATSDGSTSSLQNGVSASGSHSDNNVSVSLGYGATSIITIPGFLSLGGHSVNDIDLAGQFVDSDEHLMTSAAINDLIVAATSSTFVDLTSEVSGVLPVANGGTGASSLTDNSILTGTGTSAITAEANLTWDASMLTVSSTGDAGEPIIKIHQTQDAVPTTGGELRFDTDRGAGLVGNADDVLGTITWRGHDNQTGGSAAETIYASIVGLIQDPNNSLGSEDGKLEFNVLNQNVSNTGLLISPTGTNGHVNATIGKGTVGVVTIEGYLSLGGHNVNDIDITSEASDADDHLMTALAIKNRIEDYGLTSSGLALSSATSDLPTITLTNSNADANPPVFTFQKTATGADGDDLGRIDFKGDDGSNNVETFAQILGEIAESDHGSEEGKLTLSVASHDAEMQPGLIIASGDAEDEVDVTLGNEATSITTLSGSRLRFYSLGAADDSQLSASDNAGGGGEFTLLMGGSNNTNTGFSANGAANMSFSADVNNLISGTNLSGKNVNFTAGRGTGTGAGGKVFLGVYPTLGVSGTGKTTDDPAYHTFAHDTVDFFQFATATTGSLVTIHSNDTTVGNGGELQFKKNAADTEDGEVLGKVTFYGEDEGNNNTQFAEIVASISESDEGDEAGKLQFKVATSDSTTSALQQALTATGHATSNIVDIGLGYGAASTVTIPGKATVIGRLTAGEFSLGGHAVDDIQVAGDTFADVDDQLMSAAAIDDRINAAGGGVSVSDSTANTNFPVVFHDESNNLHDDTGAFTYNPSTGTANIPIASIPKRKFAIPADGAGNADGDIVYIGTGSTVVGKIYYYKSDGSWGLTNSDDPGTATGWLAVALGTDPDADGMLLRGTIDLAENIVGTEALGSIIYLDKATAGAATTAAPTATGDIVRVIGYALTTGDANKIWFSPDNTWVEHV